MRIAIVSDLHANLLAWRALQADLARHGCDGVWYLGDLVGRGYDPAQVLRVLQPLYEAQSPANQTGWLIGNHDLNVIGGLLGGADGRTTTELNVLEPEANAVDVQHRTILHTYAPAHLNWLRTGPVRQPHSQPYADQGAGIYLAHGSYELDDDGSVSFTAAHSGVLKEGPQIRAALHGLAPLRWGIPPAANPPRLVFGGHTHRSMVWCYDPATQQVTQCSDHHAAPLTLDLRDQLVYVNVGSAGFSREAGRLGVYVIADFAADWQQVTLTFCTLTFDVIRFRDDAPGWYPSRFINEVLARRA